MDFSAEYPTNDYSPATETISKTEFWKNFERDRCSIIKYRNIPNDKVIDMLKTPVAYCENVSGVKEVKRIVPSKRNSECQSGMNSGFDSPFFANTSEQPLRSFNASAKPVTEAQYDAQLDGIAQDRTGQGSLSEPTLALARARGDIVQDFCTEDGFTTNESFGDGKHLMDNQDIKGCIYIKHAGKVFKAVIEAKSVETDIYSTTLKNRKNSKTSNLIFNKKLKNDVFGKNSFKFSTDEYGDFDIAIFLSGLNCISDKIRQIQGISESKYKLNKNRRKEKKPKKRIPKATKSSNVTVGKVYEIARENHPTPSKSLNVFQNERRKSSRSVMPIYRNSESNTKIDLSSDESDSCIYLVNEDGSKQKLKEIRENSYFSLKLDDENQEKEAIIPNYSFNRNETSSQRSRKISQSSMSHYTGMSGVPKLKITDGELWEHFENLFKSYASTTRHSGEVIPRKTSTEWMIDAGVIDEILTEKEADDAFKSAVGVKITMNAQEYKDFLIMLTIRMKLPYYEIYRRMCGV